MLDFCALPRRQNILRQIALVCLVAGLEDLFDLQQAIVLGNALSTGSGSGLDELGTNSHSQIRDKVAWSLTRSVGHDHIALVL